MVIMNISLRIKSSKYILIILFYIEYKCNYVGLNTSVFGKEGKYLF